MADDAAVEAALRRALAVRCRASTEQAVDDADARLASALDGQRIVLLTLDDPAAIDKGEG